MSVTFPQLDGRGAAVAVGPGAWLVRWTSDLTDPIYRVFRDGSELYRTLNNWAVFTLAAGESALIEVLDNAAEMPQTAITPRVHLAWDSVAGAKRYRVERLVDAAWALVKEIEDDGQARFQYDTPPLADAATDHQLRVTTIGDNDNEATATAVNVTMIRHPDPPTNAMSFDDVTKTITVAS